MKEKCLKCYWWGGDYDHCCISWKMDFDCEKDFQLIDEYFYTFLTETWPTLKDCLIQDDEYWKWNSELS